MPTDEAFIAYEKVLDFAGASLRGRDWADAGIVTSVRTQTGRIISTPPLTGLIAWWKGEGNAIDSAGGNNGNLINDISFTNGEVNLAFNHGDQRICISSRLAVFGRWAGAWLHH